jgi:tRNA(Ile)-lysidine synthase
MDLLEGLEAFFSRPGPQAPSPPPDQRVREGWGPAPLGRGDRLVVAFSGGGDSTALLWGLSRLASTWGIEIVAAHLDHGMDPGSEARAALAGGLARRLDVPLVTARREVGTRRGAGESPEAAARRVRYEFLEEVRRGCRARYVATAHHREDQAETVLLRLRFGSGLRGLAGIRPLIGAVVRPLLSLPRAALRAAVAAAGLRPAEDPGNGDPRQPRSRMRHRLLPYLARADAACGTAAGVPAGGAGGRTELPAPPDPVAGAEGVDAELVEGLVRLAARAQGALAVLDRRLAQEIGLQTGLRALPAEPGHSGIAGGRGHRGHSGDAGETSRARADTRRLASLPPPLLTHALALLHRQAGAAYPASQAAIAELLRQLAAISHTCSSRGDVACDCGEGWRWHGRGDALCLERRPPAEDVSPFTYTLEVPGELAIPELAVTIRVSEAPVEAWMLRGAPHRAALALPLAAGGCLTVRNRRPGDRLRPLGSPGSRKLKEVLIDRGVPKERRDRLPLVCWAGEIAWVPGVTIDHRFRLTGQPRAWLAELAEIVE